MEKKFCSSKQYVNILYKRISNFYSSLWKFLYIYIFFFYLATSLKFIYLFFLSVSLKYILNGRIPLRVLFIMFAIDSNRLGILFHENRIGESYKKILSIDIFFFFSSSFFLNIRPIMDLTGVTESKIERKYRKCLRS